MSPTSAPLAGNAEPASARPVNRPVLRGARTLLLLGALAFAPAAMAADEEKVFVPGSSRVGSEVKSEGPSLNSISLILGLALAGVGGWLVLRNRRGTPVGRDQRSLAVDETRSLGNRQYLVVASYEGRKFLIGVCPGRIDMLAPLDGSAAMARRSE